MRRAAFLLGLALLAGVWLGPLPGLAKHAFAASMAMHMLVVAVAVAAPLIAVGVAGGRFDPTRPVPAVFSPVPASFVELVVVWAWHAPALHHAARQTLTMLVLEQASYLAVGLLLWLAALDGARHQRRERTAAGIAGLLLTSMHMTMLGVLLTVASRPLYTFVGVAPFGLTPLQDQRLGGILMLIFGGSTYLVANLLREQHDVASVD
jgi:putative membrane protein